MPRWSSILCFALGLMAFLFSGCDRTKPVTEQSAPAGTRLVKADSGVSRLLEQSTAAYARLQSYSDSARVVLSYKVAGRAMQDIAPLAIAFERPNRLGIRAYQVRAGVTDQRFHIRLTPNAEHAEGAQVVSRALPKQLDESWLLSDVIAHRHLSAGLAGAPPQLDLLLGDTPFQSLLDPSAEVTLDGEGSEGNQRFHIIRFQRGSARYRLWLNSQTSLVRRIELPTSNLPMPMLQDSQLSDIRLSIELDRVRIDEPIDWKEWQVPIAEGDCLVRYFVQPPMLALDARLGKKIPAFKLPTLRDQETINSSEVAKQGKVHVLAWVADHPSCRATLEQITTSVAQLPETIRAQVKVTAVWAEPAAPSGSTFDTLAQDWKINDTIAIDREAMGRDVLAVHEAPTLVILDSQHKLQCFQELANPLLGQALPEMLTRLVNGESLAQTMIDRAATEAKRYEAQLWLARSEERSHGQVNSNGPGLAKKIAEPSAYPPETIRLVEVERREGTNSTAFVADRTFRMWQLTSKGKLIEWNERGEKTNEFSLPVTSDQNASPTMEVEDAGRWLAVHDRKAAQLVLFNTETHKSQVFPTESGKTLTDHRWFTTSVGVRLAVVTNDGRMSLLDPTTGQQHSGQAAQSPLALVPRTSRDDIATGYVVLNDGHIEPILLEEQSGTKSLNAPKISPVSGPVKNSTGGSAVANSVSNPLTTRQLLFAPASGPWTVWNDDKQSTILARGWIAPEEPGLFLIDQNLQQQWHVPLPIAERATSFHATVASVPKSGQSLWAVAYPESTLHFFSGDGSIVDHCRLTKPIVGLALVPVGNQLHLWVAHSDSLVHYTVE